MHEVGRESRVAIESSCISGPISDAWHLIALLLALLCSAIYERFDFNESYFPFFVPKIADAIILYACKVLTFNCHLHHNHDNWKYFTRSFLMHYRKFDTLFSIIYS